MISHDEAVQASPEAIADALASLAAALPFASVRAESSDGHVRFEADVHTSIPYFGWAVEPLLAGSARRSLSHAGATLRARAAGRDAPPPPKPFPLSPPVAFTAEQSTLVATVAMATALCSFGASLASQNVHFVGRAFGASDAALGVALAAARTGVVVGLVATALADRRGRRKLLIVSVAGMCCGNAISAVAPSLWWFASGQVLVRGFSNAAFAVGSIAAIEEAPDGARAFTVSMLSLAAGLGYAPGLLLLPLDDAAPQAWRIAFLLSAVSILLLPGVARRLRETARWSALAAGDAVRGRVREVLDATYGRRFAIMVGASFLGAAFGAPGAQFQNRYLAEQRGLSGLGITVFVAATGVPSLVGLVAGGRLAESHGRRPVAAWGLLATTLLQMGFFVASGPLLWLASLGSSFTGGMIAPVLGALGAELFATEIRGTANGMLLVAGVAGAATGLVTAGALAARVGGIGPAVALTGVAALLAVPLMPLLPESAFRSLDDVSPSEV